VEEGLYNKTIKRISNNSPSVIKVYLSVILIYYQRTAYCCLIIEGELLL